MRNITASLILFMIIVTCVPSNSHCRGDVDIRIVSDHGREFWSIQHKKYRKGSTEVIKKYLEAKQGKNYHIEMRNRTHRRIGVVIAVDGRNIISGKKSYLSPNERMYIIEPYGYTKLEGWRTSQNNVNRFYFTDKKDSYSVKTFGDTSAMGVIAAAVFREKPRPKIKYRKKYTPKNKKEKSMAPNSSCPEKDKDDSAGTGFGNETYSPSIRVMFESEKYPYKKYLIKYEWRHVLIKKGIIKKHRKVKNRLWDEDEYAPYPPGHIR